MKGFLIRISFFIAWVIPGYAQQLQPQNQNPAVKVLANPAEGRITLRWAPTTSPAWEYGNQFGYSVQRITITRNNQTIDAKEKVRLSQSVLPRPLAEWEREVQQNKYAAVAAQALYGKKFQVSQSSGVAGLVNQAKESDQRFSFALFAADYSPTVATMAGLSFVDTNPKNDEGYLYKVWINFPDKRYAVDTGYVYTSLKDARPLPALQKPDVRFLDRQAVISWNYALYQSTYIAYFIERSADGGTFTSVSKDPIVPAENTPSPTGIINVIDTLQSNAVVYRYRVRGVSVFGESGPWSTIVEGHGVKALSAAPAIRQVSIVNDSQVKLVWEYPSEFISELNGFQLERSFKPNGPFISLTAVLKSSTKEYIDTQPGGSNYYRVLAIGDDDRTYSFPHLAQLPDSIPPAPPKGIKASIDTLGIVSLSWERGNEPDLLGYRVYRSNFDTHEYSQVTSAPVEGTLYQDTISLKTLTKQAYYKLVAIDRHFNPSEFSSPVVVDRPDIVPPPVPSFSNIAYQPGEGIVLEWLTHTETDVVQHVLYRRSSGEQQWKLLATLPAPTQSTYIDKDVSNKSIYEYILVAQDASGLASTPSSPVRMTLNDRGGKPAVERLAAKADNASKSIVLSWAYEATDVDQFKIYRTDAQGKMRLLDSVSPTQRQFKDNSVLTVNTQYQYTIKAVFKDGGQSPFSKIVKITF